MLSKDSLYKLLNDEEVCFKVLQNFRSQRPDWESLVRVILPNLSKPSALIVSQFLASERINSFSLSWQNSLLACDLDLFAGLQSISIFQGASEFSFQSLLDLWAKDFKETTWACDPLSLARFVFKKIELKPSYETALLPSYGNAVAAFNEGVAWSSVACALAVLLGRKLNILLHIVDFPGTPLLCFENKGVRFFIDPFAPSQLLEEAEFIQIHTQSTSDFSGFLHKASDLQVLNLVLRDLNRAYLSEGDSDNAFLFAELLQLTKSSVQGAFQTHMLSAEFEAGEVVVNDKHAYHGVVVNVDATCQASDAWYNSNDDHPSRQQPWYHILVSDVQKICYVAQSSLRASYNTEPLEHPLLDYFFSEFSSGRYIRNARLWPETTI